MYSFCQIFSFNFSGMWAEILSKTLGFKAGYAGTGNICLVKMGIPVPIPIYGDITLVVETKEIE